MKNKSIIYTFIALGFIITSIVLVVFANREPTSLISELNMQNKKTGDVTISVLPIRTGTKFDFEIQLNTHSTELVYKLDELASLKSDNGETLRPVAWEGDAPGGHHRTGKLLFPNFESAPKNIFLSIYNIENTNLEFNWNL